MHTYIFVVSGFTQKRSNVFGSGSHAIHKALLPWQNPTTSVRLLEWLEDPVGHARRVVATTSPDDKILINCYSYGAGYFFRKFAQELYNNGRTIDSAVLCDPVYRHPFPLFRVRAILGGPQTLTIPSNVRRVSHFVQHINKPGGDNIVFDEKPEFFTSMELPLPHIKIDNAREYLETCVKEAQLILGEPGQ